MIPVFPKSLTLLVFLALCCACAGAGRAQTAGASQALRASPTDRELVVVTKEAPPFAMKTKQGEWQGISIDLWRHIAEQQHLRYRFVEVPTVKALLDATSERRADAGVAAVTVTAARAQTNDFSQPFYSTGLGVAVASGSAQWLPVLRTFLSFRFLSAVLALLGVALFVGLLVWLLERRHNEHFGGHPVRGLTSGVWWSAVAMTQAGAAQGAPASLPGRVIAVVWMIASIILLAVFTAGLTSAITTHQLQGLVRNMDDLRSLRVGVVENSSSAELLDVERIAHQSYADPTLGLQALSKGRLDAFVYDRPLLSWLVRDKFAGLQVLSVTFGHQNYAIVLPPDSDLRVPLDVALLDTIESEWWLQTLYRYLGSVGSSQTEAGSE